MGDNIAVGEQPVKLIFAPAALERSGMHGRNGGGIALLRLRDRRLGSGKQAGNEVHHRRGS